jgi:hypothetical protein
MAKTDAKPAAIAAQALQATAECVDCRGELAAAAAAALGRVTTGRDMDIRSRDTDTLSRATTATPIQARRGAAFRRQNGSSAGPLRLRLLITVDGAVLT